MGILENSVHRATRRRSYRTSTCLELINHLESTEYGQLLSITGGALDDPYPPTRPSERHREKTRDQ